MKYVESSKIISKFFKITLGLLIFMLGACTHEAKNRSSVQFIEEPGPQEIRLQPQSVVMDSVSSHARTVDDPDDLFKYVDPRLQPYLAKIYVDNDGAYALIFKGGEGIILPSFDDLLSVRLKKKEPYSLLIDVREVVTLRISLYEGKAVEGGVVEVRRRHR